MNHKTIREALKQLNVPISFKRHEGAEDTYITFIQYDGETLQNANDEEVAELVYYQINIFSKKDYFELIKQVKQTLQALGGYRTSEQDIENKDSDYNQRSLRYRFINYM